MKKFLCNITPYHFLELLKSGVSLDMLFTLELIEKDIDIDYFFDKSFQGGDILQSLVRKGYISDSLREITTEGRALLEFTRRDPDVKVKLKKKVIITEDVFDKFWNAYPTTDNIVRDNKIVIKGSRAVRTGKKEEIKLKLGKILAEGKYTIDDIVRALKFEVNQKIEESIKYKENKLKYMQGPEPYLNNKTFEAYVEISKLKGVEEKTTINTFITDI